jgi:predicted pyridoxine 5'-phosphate oxidase superfamily flavin-nucleotide-binding protein
VAPRTRPLAQTRSTTVQRTLQAPSPSVECEPVPGSAGEHTLQCAYGTEARARRFYTEQVRDQLLPTMVAFVQRMEMVFVASADARGECDASLRAGPPGFIRVLDARTLAYPEYRGNGVHASLGNISENGHIGLLMVDFVEDLIGLHVNGTARIVEAAEFAAAFPQVPQDVERGRLAERWVVVEAEEAYVHCRKHIPRMARVQEKREWGTDDPGRKGGDYFGAKETPRWRPRPNAGRRRFPSTTHLGGGSARVLRPR